MEINIMAFAYYLGVVINNYRYDSVIYYIRANFDVYSGEGTFSPGMIKKELNFTRSNITLKLDNPLNTPIVVIQATVNSAQNVFVAPNINLLTCGLTLIRFVNDLSYY